MLGTSLEFTGIIQWISYLFPSLADYLKYVGPVFVFFTSMIGVFTNLLPEPNHKYPVPNVTDLETELGNHGGMILRMAFFARKITFAVNWFLASAPYGWFYNTTNAVSNLITRLKGGTPVTPSTAPTPISTPSPFVITMGQRRPQSIPPSAVITPSTLVEPLAPESLTPPSSIEQKSG